MTVPLFPLSIVVYPGEKLNLHIFEPRYKQLINYCVSEGSNFGISTYLNGKLALVGTEVELVKIERIYKNGEMDVTVQGKIVYQLIQVIKNETEILYPQAEIAWINNEMESDLDLVTKIFACMHELHHALSIEKSKIPVLEDFTSYKAAHYVGLNIEQEYELLTILNEKKRLEFIYKHLQLILPILQETENLKSRVQANGHFKNLMPPEL